MERVLGACEDEPAFTEDVAWPGPGEGDDVKTSEDETATKPSPEKPSPGSTEESGSVHFENCTAARDAGAGPVRRGDAGYASHLDRDGDGVGCE